MVIRAGCGGPGRLWHVTRIGQYAMEPPMQMRMTAVGSSRYHGAKPTMQGKYCSVCNHVIAYGEMAFYCDTSKEYYCIACTDFD